MGAVTAEIQINATPQQVWDVALDPNRLGDWVTIHSKLNQCDDGPPRLGFEMVQTMELRGAPLKVSWELVTCDEPHEAKWEGKGPAGSRAETSYRLEANKDGTLFHYSNEFFPPMGIIGRVAQRAIAGDLPESEALASLKQLRKLFN
jgi:carbon monoxide dehydrogenase subunit G